jgi:hypothetical protein
MKMSHLLSTLAGAALLVGAFVAPAAAQAGAPGKTVETHASKGMKGPDANVKVDVSPNKQGATVMAPPSKGGPKSKGASGSVVILNQTQWYINIYINGYFSGTVGPWGDYYTYLNCGSDTFYARAPFDDGSFIFWGPTAEPGCSASWTLRP